ncbi:hypothetical protein AMTR_s00021p00233570 [Amborella trichopoda]|uniref:RNase H type-1 domain-containing protein n=1 Tax=Amborella trichopoda TaxID=13333 RepID=W1PVP0_AMBTC|nr:hypothetical protein AMTR_s00021p00233570 [Amborella trichopoda]
MEATRGMKNLSPKRLLDLQILRTFDIPAGRSRPKILVEIIWRKPAEGWFKLNVDGCELGNPGHSRGVGIEIAKEKGVERLWIECDLIAVIEAIKG